MSQDVLPPVRVSPVRIELQPDPNALAVLQQRYGSLTRDGQFIPAPSVLNAERAFERLQTHGTVWQVMQITARVQAHGTTGEATLGGIEDDSPLQCLYSHAQAILAAEQDAQAWAGLGL